MPRFTLCGAARALAATLVWTPAWAADPSALITQNKDTGALCIQMPSNLLGSTIVTNPCNPIGTNDVGGFEAQANTLNGVSFTTFQSYKAKGDGIADDTIPVSNALASGHPVRCEGVFRITAPVITTLPIGGMYVIKGGSRFACRFVFTTTTARFEVDIVGTSPDGNMNWTHNTGQYLIEDVSVDPEAALTGNSTDASNAAFSLVAGNTYDSTSPRGFVRNLSIVPTTLTGQTWAKYGVYLKGFGEVSLDDVRCQGTQYYSWDANSACIFVQGYEFGDNTNNVPVTVHVTGMRAYNNQYGVRTKGHVEGLIVNRSEVVTGSEGIHADDGDTEGSTLIQASQNEINVSDAGINVNGWARVQLSDNHVYIAAAAPDTVTNPTCINVSANVVSEFLAQIHDNACEMGGRALRIHAVSAVPAAGGSGYAVNDTITDAAGVFRVTSVSSGAVTGLSYVSSPSIYPAPANPVPQTSTSGSGTGATLTVTYGAAGEFSYGVVFNAASLTAQGARSQVHDNIFSRSDYGVYVGSNVRLLDVGCNQFVQNGNTGRPTITPILDNSPESGTDDQRNFSTCSTSRLTTGNNAGRGQQDTPVAYADLTDPTNANGHYVACNSARDGYRQYVKNAAFSALGTNITGTGTTPTVAICDGPNAVWKAH